MRIANGEEYISAKMSILRIPDLTLGEKVLFLHIASFGEYFESIKKCAELTGFTEGTIKKMRSILEEKGYIIPIPHNGNGKKYVVKEEYRREDQTVAAETTKPLQPQPNTSLLKPAKSQRRERNDAWSRWKKAHPELLPALDACTNYLLWRKIPLVDPSSLRRQLVATSDMFKDPRDESAHVSMILTYIDYLKSDEYAYQVEHTKFCPTITTQDDLFRKFNAIREFKQDESRHYDPRKTLTRT